METMISSFILLMCFTAVIHASPVPDTQGEVVSLQLVREQEDAVVRRQDPESPMPDVLVMTLTLGGQRSVLRLQRARYPPVYLVLQEGVQEVTDLDSGLSAVYVDPSRRASFVVHKADSGHYLLDGNFRHGTDHVSLTPVTRKRRSAGDNDNNDHVVVLVENTIIQVDYDDSNNSTGASSQKAGRKRRKRSGMQMRHTVETAFVVDHTDYANWLFHFPSNTMATLRRAYTQIAQTTNNIYASVKEVDSSIDIKVPVVAFYVIQNASSGILTSNGPVEGGTYLTAFSNWIAARPSLTADHFMAFTGLDVILNGGAAVGVARKGAICDTAGSVSVVENSFSGSIAPVAAHELGHSLNASHDGTANACNASHTMGPTLTVPTSNKTYIFSSCSVATFKDYLASRRCTLPNMTSAEPVLNFADFNNFALISNRNLQCQLGLNLSSSTLCDLDVLRVNESDICVGMPCRLPNLPTDPPRLHRCRYMLPLEGTSCGSGKICYLGVCENAADVVQVSTTFDESTTEAPTTAAPTTEASTTAAPTTEDLTLTEAPTTEAPTTEAPTTEAPTTAAPTTEAPTTEAPTTEAPTTEDPTTETPTTEAPTTEAPTTEAPTTEAPTTEAPTTEAPTTEAPTTAAPTTVSPTAEAPTTEAPTTEAPTTEAPTTADPTTEDRTLTEAPTTEAPRTEAPTTEAPTTEAPTTEAPTTEAPTTEAPTTEAPTTAAPTTEVPTTEAPTTEAPTTEAPTTEAPTTADPTTDDRTLTEAPTTEAPRTEAPTTEAPTTEAPTTEAPTTEAPTTEAPTTEAPTTEAPTTEAPTTAAPTTVSPTTEAPTTADPTTEDRTLTEAPTTEAPRTEASTTEAPTTEAPTTEAPTTDAPTTEAPTTEAPTTAAPTTEAPTTEASVTGAPRTEAPTTEAPTTEAPVTTTTTPRPNIGFCFRRCSRPRYYSYCRRYNGYFTWRLYLYYYLGYPLPNSCCLMCLFQRG